jgi:hypothetical protein
VADAIRKNRKAIKLLGANLWLQQGETDRSFREETRGFFVSELIEAYGRNIPGGVAGLFDVVLAASLDLVPGRIIRNYALEGKQPIHMDRARVAALGVMPVEVNLFASDRWRRDTMLHHEPARFARAVRTVYDGLRDPQTNFLTRFRKKINKEKIQPAPCPPLSQLPCDRMKQLQLMMRQKQIKTLRPVDLLPMIDDFLWQCREIRAEHLAYFDSIQILPTNQWGRKLHWDSARSYYDPSIRAILIHEEALRQPNLLYSSLAIALGQSLLGDYIERREMENVSFGRVYRIQLRPPGSRTCFLDDLQLRHYLKLAGMRSTPQKLLEYWRLDTQQYGFLPSGALFGMTFAWYINNNFAPPIDNEMDLLQWPSRMLLPHQVHRKEKLRALVRFFREQIFA